MKRLRRHAGRVGDRRVRWGWLALGMLPALACVASARAEVTVLLEQPYGTLGLLAPAGHTAIYLDRVCAATPTQLRACRPGEMGVVLSKYDGIDNKDWVAMPLLPYLYAVQSEAEIPASVDAEQVKGMRDAYRRRDLRALAPDTAEGAAPDGNWYELVGAAYDRTIYGFSMKSTAEQDAALVAKFNDKRNVEDYNGFYNNCADFVRTTVNMFYPHAVRRDYVAQLGMTSPKSVARGVVHYARKHPGTDFTVFVIPQVPGSLRRSSSNVGLAEGVLKRLGLPLVIVSPVVTGVVLAAYVTHGRMSLPKNAPALDLASLHEHLRWERPWAVDAPELPAPVSTQVVLAGGTAPVNIAGATDSELSGGRVARPVAVAAAPASFSLVH